MQYKVFVFCPDDEKVIDNIIDAASTAGAGVMGNYTRVAFVSKGKGRWLANPGAHPAIGSVARVSHENEVKIEMVCPSTRAKAVALAIRKIHPYEEPAIEFVKIEAIT